jgi:alkylhydroperoxidase family enzyme
LARRLGAKEEWIAAARPEEPEEGATTEGSEDGMEQGWTLALRYAELVTESGHSVSDDDYEKLAAHWNEGELVEITMVIGLFSYFNRFNDALRVEITR